MHISILPAQLVYIATADGRSSLQASVVCVCNTHRDVEMGDIAQSCGEKAFINLQYGSL